MFAWTINYNLLGFLWLIAGIFGREGSQEDIDSMEAVNAGGHWGLWNLYLYDRNRSEIVT